MESRGGRNESVDLLLPTQDCRCVSIKELLAENTMPTFAEKVMMMMTGAK